MNRIIITISFFIGMTFMLCEKSTAFNYSGKHWNIRNVSYYLWNPPNAAVIQAHVLSEQTWDNAGANFTFTYSGTISNMPGGNGDFKNVVGGADASQFAPFEAAKTVIWVKPEPPDIISECDMMINLGIPMSTSGDPNAYDIQTISLHEFGHWLRLGHVSAPNSVMCEEIGLGQIRRVLDDDSRNGIVYIYGPR